ncbi:hypothetical protein F4778DRAFT_395714 [Xylariomycetidae sp. FL2044]|nr:hypothetical protein F4778DRAFT_395714 [Xylariomycetidae sp. FL2044]
MSQYQNARNMDQSSGMGGSVRKARERAELGGQRVSPPPGSDPVTRRLQAPPGFQTKDGQFGMAISRPTPVPQWPLAGPIGSPVTTDTEPYRPPPGKSQPPQRPPRPSRVPSILDGSRVQDHTPVFQYTPQTSRSSELSAPDTAATLSSRPSTLSSVGSIPDFPLPVSAPPPPPPPSAMPRRSVNLGPPPSARRGASSFYSTASFVSPIPEESLGSRSRGSYASSAAIPGSFGDQSPGYSPSEVFFDDAIAEESIISDDADSSRLVRSASIGKRGKPSLVTTRSAERREEIEMLRPSPSPMQGGPFRDGTGFLDASSSSSGRASSKEASVGAAVTTDTMLNAYEAASATDPSTIRKATPSPRPFRLSGLRRPPRLDIDAVRAAEARGSLTSLPDLIKRATRLASLMERGRRPASQFDALDFPEDVYGGDPGKGTSYDPEKYQSGLSDMLAAFPPPGSRRSMRQSGTSWPLPIGASRASRGPPVVTERSVDDDRQDRRRKCCGLPLWGFLFLVFIILCIIAAAVVVPLELLVFNKADTNDAAGQTAGECGAQLVCQNGGTNVIIQSTCSCICSNGFTGTDCSIPASQGCTTTTINTGDQTIDNVTIGQAIPRLVEDAQSSFNVPLDAATIQTKFNSANLSCVTENALVTFNGQFSSADDSVADVSDGSVVNNAGSGSNDDLFTLTLTDVGLTLTLDAPGGSDGIMITTITTPTMISGSVSTIFETTITASMPYQTSGASNPVSTSVPPSTSPTTSSTLAPGTTTTTAASTPTATFTVSDEAVDFARVAVLYILQEETLEDASDAQTALSRFFSEATSGISEDEASSLNVGGNNTIDLVNLFVDVGAGRIGGGSSNS